MLTASSGVVFGQDIGHLKVEKLDLFDASRSRSVPVTLYFSDKQAGKKVAILNHGYGIENTAYTFLAKNLVHLGYTVASIQHQLSTDEPMPTTGNVYAARKPSWERGVENIIFVLKEIKKIKPALETGRPLLIGHSHGGDTAMLFASEHPGQVKYVISLDNRRMPIPRVARPRILTIRSSDQPADPGVLPSEAECRKYHIKIKKLADTIHNDMWDGATDNQKLEINRIITDFLIK